MRAMAGHGERIPTPNIPHSRFLPFSNDPHPTLDPFPLPPPCYKLGSAPASSRRVASRLVVALHCAHDPPIRAQLGHPPNIMAQLKAARVADVPMALDVLAAGAPATSAILGTYGLFNIHCVASRHRAAAALVISLVMQQRWTRRVLGGRGGGGGGGGGRGSR